MDWSHADTPRAGDCPIPSIHCRSHVTADTQCRRDDPITRCVSSERIFFAVFEGSNPETFFHDFARGFARDNPSSLRSFRARHNPYLTLWKVDRKFRRCLILHLLFLKLIWITFSPLFQSPIGSPLSQHQVQLPQWCLRKIPPAFSVQSSLEIKAFLQLKEIAEPFHVFWRKLLVAHLNQLCGILSEILPPIRQCRTGEQNTPSCDISICYRIRKTYNGESAVISYVRLQCLELFVRLV